MENELAAAYASPNPATNQMAAQGRGGDQMMAHVTPGDYVIPKDILVQHPDFLVKLKKVMADEHEDYRTHLVGSGFENINPETGAPEFGFKLNFKNFIRGAGDAVTLGGASGNFGDLGVYTRGAANMYSGGMVGGYDRKSSQNTSGPAPYTPSAMALPSSLQEMKGLTDQQQRSYLATQGTQGDLGGSGAEYYANLLQRNIQANPNQDLLPVESQYLNMHNINSNLRGQDLVNALRGF